MYNAAHSLRCGRRDYEGALTEQYFCFCECYHMKYKSGKCTHLLLKIEVLPIVRSSGMLFFCRSSPISSAIILVVLSAQIVFDLPDGSQAEQKVSFALRRLQRGPVNT